MSYEYSENQMIQESAGTLLETELGWQVAYAYNTEKLGKDGTFGRVSYKEILLTRYLKDALFSLNPWLTDDLCKQVVQTLQTHLSSDSLLQINEKNYALLRDGVPVAVKQKNGTIKEQRAMVFNFQDPTKNHFLAIKELKIHGENYRRRTDIVGFVNGIPLLFIELKKATVDVYNAYIDNFRDYQDTIPQLFHFNAFVMLSNGLEAKVGTLGSKYEFFHEWKRLSQNDAGSVALETMLRGICNKTTFLDLFENFILFDHSGGRTAKILARNHQYLGVNEAVEAYRERKLRDGKLGVFWHTQGSGKSYSMLFLAQKIRRKFQGSPTFVILTDRDDLNKQISDTFANCGLLGKSSAKQSIATSGADLMRKLQGNPSFIFTLIQKFHKKPEAPIVHNHDIIIMSDEAHRSQNGVYAGNMVQLLPSASRIGFTGTPLFANDNITERTFGGYVSIYDFKRAVEDGATVPLYYENRGEKIGSLRNEQITQEIMDAIEAADLDVNQQEKLEREFAKEIHVLTGEPRLKTIAEDFVEHYSNLWTSGKAMFVCLNKVTCVRMYDLVQAQWNVKIAQTEQLLKTATQQEYQELDRKLTWLKETEMAVVISQEQNEVDTFKKWGLDIATHRTKMEKRELDIDYKNSDHPLRIVFVCAMWLTGFDVKSLSCLYLDKPLKAHTLMQTIARANRVAEGKSNGLVVDYIGIVKALRKALAAYTSDAGTGSGNDPTIDKGELIERILTILKETEIFLSGLGFSLKALVEAEGFQKLAFLKDGADTVCVNLETKKAFQIYANELIRMLKFIDRSELTYQQHRYKDAVLEIDSLLQQKRKKADNTDLMVQINQIVNANLIMETPTPGLAVSKQFDISKIDFDLLRAEFARTKHKNLQMQDLSQLIAQRIEQMLKVNPFRIDYYERYQKIIDEYNAEQDRSAIEKTFMDLMNLANDLSEEQQRYAREGFQSDEELSIFDLLFKESLTPYEIRKIKTLAVELLSKIKETISTLDHWTDKEETKAVVDNVIRDTLYEHLPESYSDESINQYRQEVYSYVYSHYQNVA